MCTEKKDEVNWVTKRIIQISILFILGIIVYSFSNGINGNDFWWHVKVGEWICENKSIPTTDIFSWCGIEKGIEWTAHEWLSDVIFYGINSTMGEAGIYFFSVLAAIVLTLLLINYVKKYFARNVIIGIIFFVLYSVMVVSFFYGRPHIFSYFLLFYELKILYEFYENPDSKCIYGLPIIGCLWSNLHGGSSNMSYILCFVFLGVSLIQINYGRIESNRLEKKHIVKLMIMSVSTVGSILLNPVGLKVLVYPYESVGNELMMSVISEWQAPDAKSLWCLIFYFFPIFLLTLGILVNETKLKLIDIAIMIVFLYLFFRSIRFVFLWYIAACFYGFKYVPQCRIKEVEKKAEKCVIYAIMLGGLMFTIVSFYSILLPKENNEYIKKVMSHDAIEAIKREKPSRIYNDYNLGEALIYNDIPVFFDARADLYAQEHIFEDGINLTGLVSRSSEYDVVDVEYLVDKYAFDGIIILKKRALYTYLQSHPEIYECKYEDENVCYYGVKRYKE